MAGEGATALGNFSARHSSPASVLPCFSSFLPLLLSNEHLIQYAFRVLRPNEPFCGKFERSLRQRGVFGGCHRVVQESRSNSVLALRAGIWEYVL